MSNIIHKFADKLSGHEQHKDDPSMNPHRDQMSSHQKNDQQSRMREARNTSSIEKGSGMRTDMGTGMDAREAATSFGDDEHTSRQGKAKNMRDIRDKDHYDEYDDDFGDSPHMGGRTQFSTDTSGFQMNPPSAMCEGTGMTGHPSQTTQADWTQQRSQENKGQQNYEYANDDW